MALSYNPLDHEWFSYCFDIRDLELMDNVPDFDILIFQTFFAEFGMQIRHLRWCDWQYRPQWNDYRVIFKLELVDPLFDWAIHYNYGR